MEDFNFDAVDEIGRQQRQANQSVSADSNLPDSISGLGIDENNQAANEQFLQENQQPQAVINALGVVQEKEDSGLASSISRTRSSEFIPELIEFHTKEDESSSQLAEEQLETKFDSAHDDNEPSDELSEEFESTFDLALSKGYFEQAKYFFDDNESKGLALKTKYVKKLKDLAPQTEQEDVAPDQGEKKIDLEDEYWQNPYVIYKIKILEMDFKSYLEKIEKNDFKGLRREIEKKTEKNEDEKTILKNIKTKKNRKNKKEETIQIIKDYLMKLVGFEKCLKSSFLNDNSRTNNK